MSSSIALRRWGLHGAGVERATQLIHNEGGERFAFHFLGDDQERLAGTSDLLEHGQQVLHVADLLLMNQGVGETTRNACRQLARLGEDRAATFGRQSPLTNSINREE